MTPGLNHDPSRRARRWALPALFLAFVLVGVGGYLSFQGRARQDIAIGGPFNLVDGDGRAVTDKSFRGRYMLVYFGYTSCPDVCPATLTEMADAVDKLGPKAARVQPIFITVDPARDTPGVVKRFAVSFGPDLIGLTGSADAIAQAERAYRVYHEVHRTGAGPDDYSVDHSSIVYLMGPDGAFLAPVSADASGSEMAAQIGRLVS